MARCIDLMRHAMTLVADGATIQPIRQVLRHPGGQGALSMMPGYTGDPDWLGIKVLTVFPANHGTQLGSHQGMVVLFDTRNGSPTALIDAREITAIRTAAATAVATDALARPDAVSLGIFGYGDQAASHLEALVAVRPFQRIVVWGRDPARAEAFAREQSSRLGVRVDAVTDAEQAGTSDVVVTVTAAPEPVFFSRWLQPGQHLNAVGSSIPATSEIDEDTVVRTRMFVDFRDSALALAGDFRRARERGLVGDDHIVGTIGDVLRKRFQPRPSGDEVTLFKSLGMICEDLIACDHVLREARRREVGAWIDW
jgi:ornithine cyclodeaminase